MDLTLTSEEEAFRDEFRAWLAENHPGPAPQGGDQVQFEFEREWQRKLHAGGWAGRLVAEGVRRPRRDPDRAVDLRRGAGAREGAAPGERPRPRDGRPGGHRPRHRGAEGALPRADPLGRGDLVPGLLRARVGLRPRLAEDQGGARRTAAGGSPARRSGRRSPTRRSGACSSPAPTPTCPSTRASPTSSWTWSRTRSRSARCARSPARRSSTSSSSRTPTSPTRTSSAASATAGWSRSRR